MQHYRDNRYAQNIRHGYDAAITPSLRSQRTEYQPAAFDEGIIAAEDDNFDRDENPALDSYEEYLNNNSIPAEEEYELSESGLTNRMHALTQLKNAPHDPDQNSRNWNRDQQPPISRSQSYLPTRDHRTAQLRSPYPEEGPSSLQTRLQSFQVQKASQARSLPSAARIPTEPETQFLPIQQDNLPSSPTPNHTFAAQPSNLGPIPLPLQLEFTAPADFVPMETGRKSDSFLTQLPVTYIPIPFRSIFQFRHFNKAQSVAFRDLYLSDKNVVVTAPTGAGKTTLFELAFLHMLNTESEGRAVYLAPTKALCWERFNDWSQRLKRINCKVILLTSDTKTRLVDAMSARLIVATPEKWDYMTRRARSSDRLMASLRLFLIDEVHILREMRRGAVMEVLVARMKFYSNQIRFVAVSATIPNSSDVALWIGKRENQPEIMTVEGVQGRDDAAQLYTFSEAFRPCPLQKFVYGYRNARKDDWAFERELNSRLIEVIKSHSNNKAALIFCSSRKSSSSAAHTLAKIYRDLESKSSPLPWTVSPTRPEQIAVEDAQLQELYACGVGFHHAGLSHSDRKTIERAFLEGHLTILCSTSSLAVGVNLPAYLVVIRGTTIFDGEKRDYGDLDVFQMMGRAGRPQFDTEGVCVIMTEHEHKQRWTDLLRGETTVESTLHHALIEHANAEIVIRQGCSVLEIQAWLRETFFFVRLSKKPEYYKLPGCEEVADADEALYVTSKRIMKDLSDNDLVEDYEDQNDEHRVTSSEYGFIMARYGLRFETMQALMKVKRNSSLQQLMEVTSNAKEFDTILLRAGEKGLYDGVRECEGIRYPPSSLETVVDKISVILQAKLAGLPLEDMLRNQGQLLSVNPRSDVSTILEHAPNISRALLNIAIERMDGGTARSAFELLRSINGRAWEDSPATLQQIDGIGDAFMRALADNGINSIDALARSKVEEVRFILNRSQAVAKKMIQQARRFPRFNLQVKESFSKIVKGKGAESDIDIVVELSNAKADVKKIPLLDAKGSTHNVALLISTTEAKSRNCIWIRAPLSTLVEGAELPTQKVWIRNPDEEIVITIACESLQSGSSETRIRSSCPLKMLVNLDLEGSETGSVESELSDFESGSHDKAKTVKMQTKRLDKSGASSNHNHSRILQELHQVDSCIVSKTDNSMERGKDKQAGQMDKSKKAAKGPKKPVKTAEMKRAEELMNKDDEERLLRRLDGIKQRREAENLAAKDLRGKKKRSEGTISTLKLLEAEKSREVQSSDDDDDAQYELEEQAFECVDSCEEPKKVGRKRIKPDDWSFQIGGLCDDDDDNSVKDQGVARIRPNHLRKGEELEAGDDGSESPLPNPRTVAPASKSGYKVPEQGNSKQPIKEYIIIDSDSDDDEQVYNDDWSHADPDNVEEYSQHYSQMDQDDYSNNYDNRQDTVEWIRGRDAQAMNSVPESVVSMEEDGRDFIETEQSLEETVVDDTGNHQQREKHCAAMDGYEDVAGLPSSDLHNRSSVFGPFSQRPPNAGEQQEIQGPFLPAPPSSPQPIDYELYSRNRRLQGLDDVTSRNEPGYLDRLLNDFD